ncbi:MAG: EF-hand domain-containing protein [Phycisphaerales bacterium]|nr:EF-hand domain-containing protein [Phycisphaerales bacterium]
MLSITRSLGAAVFLSAAAAQAQVTLYAVDFPGNLYTVDMGTGAATLVAPTGFTRINAAAADAAGNIYISHIRDTSNPQDVNQLIRLNAGGGSTVIASYGTDNDLRGLAFVGGQLYGTRDVSTLDDVVKIDAATGVVTTIGPTGRGDIQGLTADGSGQLYAIGISATGTLCTINAGTGLATVVVSGIGAGSDLQAIEWIGGTSAVLGRTNLQKLDLVTGAVSMIGPFGVGDVRGLAAVQGAAPCYPDCNGDGALNLSDFGCFTTKFALGDPYADCNGDGVLNLADFGCFTTKFALGCP